MSGFGENLNKLRKKHAYSQEEFANRLNVTRQTVSKWELDQTTPNLKELEKISQIFNISIDELVLEENKINNNIPQTDKKIKYKKILLFFIIVILLIFVVVIGFRSIHILILKSTLDKSCFSNNYMLIKNITIDKDYQQQIDEYYELYVLNNSKKLIKYNNIDISKPEIIEIYTDTVFYHIDNINKNYYMMTIEEFNNKNLELFYTIDKDSIVNEIYKHCLLFENNDIINLIFNFDYKVQKDYKNNQININNIKNRIDSFVFLKTDRSIKENNFEYIEKTNKNHEMNFSKQYNYSIKLDCVDKNDFVIPNLEQYQKIDI